MRRAAAIGPCLAVLASFAASPALASTTSDQCVDANSRGQLLRREGRLGAARDELRSCAEARCPAMVRDDCTQRLDELNRAQPTLVFDAKDASGNDVAAVVVTVDGHVLAEKLDGSPLNVDPGPHTFEFAVAGQPRMTRTFVVKEGEKARVERILFDPAASPATLSARATFSAPSSAPFPGVPAGDAATPAPADSEASGGFGAGRVIGLVAGAVGVGALAAGTVFGLLAQSAWNRSSGACNAASCPESTRPQAQSDRQTAVTDGNVSTVAFVAGGVLVAGGITLFLASPSPQGRPRAVGLRVAPTWGPHAAGLHLQGDF